MHVLSCLHVDMIRTLDCFQSLSIKGQICEVTVGEVAEVVTEVIMPHCDD